MNAQQRGNYQAAAQSGQGSQFLGSHPGLANRINQVNPNSQQASRIQQFNAGGTPQGRMAPQMSRPAQMPGGNFSAPGAPPQAPSPMQGGNGWGGGEPQPMAQSPWGGGSNTLGGLTQGPQSLPFAPGQRNGPGSMQQPSSPSDFGPMTTGPSSLSSGYRQPNPMQGGRYGAGGSMQQPSNPSDFGPMTTGPRSLSPGYGQPASGSQSWQGQVNQGMSQVLGNRMSPGQKFGAGSLQQPSSSSDFGPITQGSQRF